MLTHALVVAAALLAAVFAAVGIVVRQRATLDVPADKGVSATMFRSLLRSKLWWAGTGSAVAGYAFQALALAYGSLILVQPLLVSALLFALPLSARLSNRAVTRVDWAWAGLLTISLAVFVLVARTEPGDYEVSLRALFTAVVLCSAFVVGCVALALRADGWIRAELLAIAVGVLFGAIAVLTKIVMHAVTSGSGLGWLITPALPVLLCASVIGTLLQQSAFHAGKLQASVPTMLVLEPVVAVGLGALMLGEHLIFEGLQPIVLGATIAAMTAATIALGWGEGAHEERLEAIVEKRS
ncbi:DMT family transporter [Mycobacterium sp. MYCO198283]|uniref:DMT family transporter n=1 Tax=Mycobacterium sp. MYCO198283 TaxID=2883505 RepID=UPI001E404F7A|nr:DMT family transporter [Mycobacterium sp. MYCO198283]MCG5433149.1 DMT family transporter [Mycobacterium sp. MYCO198283]